VSNAAPQRRAAKAVEMVGWIVVGLLTSVKGEPILWGALGAFAVLAIYRFVAIVRPALSHEHAY
jgi:hypothetical protein